MGLKTGSIGNHQSRLKNNLRSSIFNPINISPTLREITFRKRKRKVSLDFFQRTNDFNFPCTHNFLVSQEVNEPQSNHITQDQKRSFS